MNQRVPTPEQVLRHFIGFERSLSNAGSYPPHNIERIGEEHYLLTIAVAGFSREEIDMTVYKGTLTVSGRKLLGPKPTSRPIQLLHQGIAFRDWDRQFHLGDYIEVTGARMENGLLIIDLEHRVPEELKPKQIQIR